MEIKNLFVENSYFIYEEDINGNLKPLLTTEYIDSGFKGLYCSYHNLGKLTIPDGITHVFCHHNHLKELKLPSSLIRLECDKELFIYDEHKSKNIAIRYE